MKYKKVLFGALLSAAMMLSFIPAAASAGEAPEAETLAVNTHADGSVSLEGFDADALLMQYIDQKVAEETAPDGEATVSAASVSVHPRKGNLDDVAWNMYDALAPLVSDVAAGDRDDTSFVVPATRIFERAGFDADTLGVDRLLDGEGYITEEAYDAFKRELYNSLSVSLSDMLNAMIVDMPYELYWFDSVNGIEFAIPEYWLEENMRSFNDGESIGITPDDSLEITFYFYVSQDYSQGGSAEHYGPARTTKADTNFTKAAASTAQNIAGILVEAQDMSDVQKLALYRDEICRLTSYHDSAMEDPDFPYGDPWQLIYVFDGDANTNVVCEGYSKAFQYLCDNTTFANHAVESFLVWGTMTGNTNGAVVGGDHMWNIVHMDDGHNYIADITNCDDDTVTSESASFPGEVFLREAISGSADDGYTYRFNGGTLKYVYDEQLFRLFSAGELTLSDRSYPYNKGNDDIVKVKNPMTASGKTVTLKAITLKTKNQTIALKNAFAVSKAQGTVSYTLKKVSNTSAANKFSVSQKGAITAKKGLKAGTYQLTIAVKAAGNANYNSLTKNVTVTIKVIKVANPLTVSGKTVKKKAKTLKKKKQTIAAKNAFAVSKAQGTVTYKLVKVSKKSAVKNFSISKKGTITAKKGLKKGTYKLTVAVKAAGNAYYKAKTKNVAVTVQVK